MRAAAAAKPLRGAPMSGRISVVNTVYCQNTGEQPMSKTTRWYRWLTSKDGPVEKTYTVSKAWLALPNMEGASQVLIINKSTEFEVDVDGWIIMPGEDMRGNPPANVRVRCLDGEAEIRIVVFPT